MARLRTAWRWLDTNVFRHPLWSVLLSGLLLAMLLSYLRLGR